MRYKMKLLILLGAITLVSCSTLVPVVVPLELPDPLDLPKISADHMMCLSDDAYVNLVKRDQMQSSRIETLRAIIETTHE